MKTVYFNNTAAFDIDAMKGFTNLCPNELPVEGGETIVEECLKNHSKAKFKVMSKDAHGIGAKWEATPETPQFSPVGLPDVDIHWNRHCVVATYGFELLEGLPHPSQYDFILYKGAEPDMHPYSPIYHDLAKRISTGVIEWANSNNIKTFIIGGLALNSEMIPLCVGSGIIDLVKNGFHVILNLGATKGLGSIEGKNNFIEMLENEYNVDVINSADEIELILV